jgi:anti-sigma factor RsiW
MMSACNEYELLIEAHADGELAADQTKALQEHLAECPGCSAYHSEMTRLNSMLGDLTLPDDAPDVSAAVVAGIRRRAWRRFALVAVGVLLVKLMDVLGVFGGGAMPRLIVMAIALLLFALLQVNPFRIVRPEEVRLVPSPREGGNHGNA